jgi:hypothetical protein
MKEHKKSPSGPDERRTKEGAVGSGGKTANDIILCVMH